MKYPKKVHHALHHSVVHQTYGEFAIVGAVKGVSCRVEDRGRVTVSHAALTEQKKALTTQESTKEEKVMAHRSGGPENKVSLLVSRIR